MDLVDRIESTRFLGCEFLLWLGFCRDVLEGDVPAGELGEVDVSIESPLTFEDPLAATESVVVRGADPCGSPEAEQALLSGKLPRKAALRLIFEQSEWLCTVDFQRLALSSVTLPALTSEDPDERLFERLRLLEQLDDLIQALYAQFLGVRLGPVWQRVFHPAIGDWVKGELSLAADECRRLHRRARLNG
jgi:hypothetical protein